jgi:hypothetical protein
MSDVVRLSSARIVRPIAVTKNRAARTAVVRVRRFA